MISKIRFRFALMAMLACLTASVGAGADDTAATRVEGFSVPRWAKPATQATPPTRTLHITFAMQPAALAALKAFTLSQRDPTSPNYHRWLTPQQVGQQFGATDADIAAVTAFAQAQGFTITHIWSNRLFVSVDATVAQAEQAFQVKLGTYTLPPGMTQGTDTTFIAPDQKPALPAALAGRVFAVHGLGYLPILRHHMSVPRPVADPVPAPFAPLFALPGRQAGGPTPLSPANVSKIWDFDALHNAGFTGKGGSVDIWSPTRFSTSDLDVFAQQFNLSGYTVTQTLVDGGPTDRSGETEAALDGEMVMGQAPSCTINYVEGPNNASNAVDMWNQIAEDNPPVAFTCWGFDEYDSEQDGLESTDMSVDTALTALAAQGISLFCASGDGGSTDDSTGNVTTVDFPGSDPNVTAVGGTSLTLSSSGGWGSETGWQYSGGGVSAWFANPSWQTGPGVPSSSFRQVPDVALLADENDPGYYEYQGNSWFAVGGTSASTPNWVAATLLIILEGNQRLGLINPLLYQLGTEFNDSAQFFVYHDITSGSNGDYSCTPGWDRVTGWGSADFGKLGADITQLPDYAPKNPGASGPGGTWTSPIMIDTSATAVGEPSSFNDQTYYYIAIAASDLGPADAPGSVADIQIDGVNHVVTLGPIAADGYVYALDGLTTPFYAGSHTIKLIVNANNAVKETSNSNNTYTRTITVASTGGALTGISTSASTVASGTSVSGAVTLSKTDLLPATVNLTSSNTALLQVPASATIAAGQTSGAFTAATSGATTTTTVTITATYGGVSKTTTVTVRPSVLVASLSLTPAALAGGTSSTGTVKLNQTSSSAVMVTLTSSAPSVLALPASVQIPAGSTSATFTLTSVPVSVNTSVTVTATYGASKQTAVATVTAPVPASVSLSPASVQGGLTSTATVTLSSAAPAGGLTIALTSSKSAAAVPASVIISAKSTSASVTVTTSGVTSNQSAVITATANSVSRSTALTVTPPPAVSSVSVSPSSVFGGTSVTGTISLSANTGVATLVSISSSNKSVAQTPATVTIPANAKSATFTVTTSPVTGNASISLKAADSAGGSSATLQVLALSISSLTLNPSAVQGGVSSTGTITLNNPAEASGLTVTLTSSSSSAAIPATVTIPAGKSSATFTVSTSAVTAKVNAAIKAAVGSTSKTVTLTITPPPGVDAVSVAPNEVPGGTSSTGAVKLKAVTPVATVVTLSSSDAAAAAPPASVTVAANSDKATFTIKTTPVATSVKPVITATTPSGSATATLKVVAPSASGVSLSPASVIGGSTSTGTVTLSLPAPAGGLSVSLSSSSADATVPAAVTIAAGQTTATFTIQTSAVASGTTAAIKATVNGSTATATLTIKP